MNFTTQNNFFHINSDEEFYQILNEATKNNIKVFVKFGAEWCAPCKKIEPFYKKISENYKNCIFLSVDIDKAEMVSNKYNITSVPTFIVCKNNSYLELMKGPDSNKLNEILKNTINML